MVCANCGTESNGPNARFCGRCGRPLWHACPHAGCGGRVSAASARAPRYRCPACRRLILTCEVCGWVAAPGAERCVNPHCPPGSLRGAPAPCSALAGGPARSGEHVLTPPIADGPPLDPLRFAVDGRVTGVAAGRAALLAAMQDGRLLAFDLPNWPEPPGAPHAFALPARPLDVPDPLATAGDRVYALTEDGACVLDAADSYAAVADAPGRFVAHVASPAGWLLVESDPSGVRFHRRRPDGSSAGIRPLPAPSPLADPAWLLPAAGADAAFWADAYGQAWRLPWAGGAAEPLGPAAGVPSTVMLSHDALYVLPIVSTAKAVRIHRNGNAETFAVRGRAPLAAALSSGIGQRRLWLGVDGRGRVRGVDLALIHQFGSPPCLRDEARQLAVVRRADGTACVLAVLADQGLYLRAWKDEAPFSEGVAVRAVAPAQRDTSARLTIADPWACFSYNADGQAVFTFNLLS